MRGKWLLISATVVLLAIAAGAVSVLRERARSQAARPEPAAQPRVFTGSVVSLPGTIRAQTVVPVAAPIEGTVETVMVEAGQAVHEGQLLGRIKNTGLEGRQQAATADAEKAEARLNQLETEMMSARLEASRARADAIRAQQEYDRAERYYLRQQMLHKEGATPRLVFEKAVAEFESARTARDNLAALARSAEDRLASVVSKLDAARKSVEDATQALEGVREQAAAAEIHSPVTGLVVACTKRAGEEVTPEVSDLFRVAVNLSELEAVLEPEPPVLARIRTGQEALVVVADVPDALAGKVKEISGNQVIVEFRSPNPAVRPGGTAQVRIKLG